MTTWVFVDANVLLDVLAEREGFYADATRVWTLAESGRIEAHVAVISLSNCCYILRKHAGRRNAEKAIRLLRDVFKPVDLTGRSSSGTAGVDLPRGASYDPDCTGSRDHVTEAVTMRRNLTLAIEEGVLHRARLVAAQRKRTLTGLVRDFLQDLARQDRARASALGRLRRLMATTPLEVGPTKWKRGDLHER